MMTIKGFATLCQCTAQTLRYYDQVGLLKPARVDERSGYRYYDEKQAVDFVKIKNLQAADFTISEIKALLAKTDQAVFDAFERKIAAQRAKLQQIIHIQQTYLREKSIMENIHQNMISYILSQCCHPELLAEFGLIPENYERVITVLRSWLAQQMASSGASPNNVTLQINDDEVISDAAQIAERITHLTSDNLNDTILLTDTMKLAQERDDEDAFETVWECHGWSHVRDFMEDIPVLNDQKDYAFTFRLADPELLRDLSFPVFMLGVMLLRQGEDIRMTGCQCDHSADGENHFTLQKRK